MLVSPGTTDEVESSQAGYASMDPESGLWPCRAHRERMPRNGWIVTRITATTPVKAKLAE